MTQISIGELPDYTFDNQTFSQGLDKFYVESNQVKLINNNRGYDTLRIYFYIRPSFLTLESKAGKIISINEDGNDIVFKFNSLPRDFSDNIAYDIVGYKTPNKIKKWDLLPVPESVSVVGKEMRFKKEEIT